jgi:hypothetical protein
VRHNVTHRSVERRNFEIAAVEKDQRYWKGYDVAGRFLVKVNPKRKALKAKANRHVVGVYLIRFRSRTNPVYAFLKIGITNDIKGRFDLDSHRYTTEIVATLYGLRRQEAVNIEKKLHGMFKVWSHIPRVPLMSKGNTECFEDQARVISRTMAVFSAFKAEMKRLGRYSSDGEQSPCKGKRGVSRPPAGTSLPAKH